MSSVARLFESSPGKKFVMAATGTVLFLFVVGHLVGNLQIFLGPEAINRYGHFLQSNLGMIWVVRSGLTLILGLHIWSAAKVSRENKAARPVGYAAKPAEPAASYASRTMLMSGLMVAAFIIYHLLHYTVQVPAVNLAGKEFLTLHDEQGRHDVYAMIILGFQQPLVSGFYIVAIGLLCTHLSHGLGAMFQSLGLKTHYWAAAVDMGAKLVAGVIFLGYTSIPVAVLCGLGKEGLK